MNEFVKELSLFDIKLRNYLSIFDYKKTYSFSEQYYITHKIPYFWLNTSTIVTKYKIHTINGIVEYPIIGIYHILKKQRIKKELLYIIKYKILYNEFNLPADIVIYILSI
jgi:hypothetical protein